MDCEARQLKVLKAARSLMAKSGHNFTLVDLCNKARISKSQLRQIYPNKAVLISALRVDFAEPVVEANPVADIANPPMLSTEFHYEKESEEFVEQLVASVEPALLGTVNLAIAEPAADIVEPISEAVNPPAPSAAFQDADQAGPAELSLPCAAAEEIAEPVTEVAQPVPEAVSPPVPSANLHDAGQVGGRIDHRFRVLERAIELLEKRIDAVDGGNGHQLPREAAGMEQAFSAAAQPQALSSLTIAAHEFQGVHPEMHADICDSASVSLTEEEDLPPLIGAPPVRSPAGAPRITREMLDSARFLAQTVADTHVTHEKSERKSNMLTLMSAAIIVIVGLVVGIVSMGGAARATRSPFATASETLALASGVTIINATGAVVEDQMTPAKKALVVRAEQGDGGAQADLALAYLRGDGVVSNSAAAMGWAGLAAAKGQPLGQFILATLYNSGIKPDAQAGFKWMSAAALNGNVKAMHNVAVAFISGSGIEKNPVEAANWFGKAASMGYRDSAFDLAVLYERGEGVSQSTQRALYWYDKAANTGDKEAAHRASLLRFGGTEVAKKEDDLPN